MHVILLASIASLTLAVPVPGVHRKYLVKRGIFDNISHFPFLASSSSAHGSSGSSSSSSSSDEHDLHDYHHDSFPDFHSVSHGHVIHHPEIDGHHPDFLHSYDHNVPISYQNQYFGHDFPTSYHSQHLFDNHLSHDDHFNDFNTFDSLLETSHLDAPEFEDHGLDHGYIGDYKNYGGDLGEYSHHAGLLDISDDHKIDHLLDPYSPNHSSYDSY